MANILAREDQIFALKLLVEGSSLRSITRLTGTHRSTVMTLLVKFGDKCREFLDRTQTNIEVSRIEADEIWTFVRKKQGRLKDDEHDDPTIGDQYLFVAQDARSKLIITFAIGKRNGAVTEAFIDDLSSRVILPSDPNTPWRDKPQISTDGWQSYPGAIQEAFGSRVAHGVLIKNYHNTEQPGRYGPPTMSGTERIGVVGIENVRTICTSHVERNNLTIRTFMKRFTRLSLGFSKKLDNLAAAVALHVAYFNFCWRPREKDGPKAGRLRNTPAMEAKLTATLWTMDDLYDAVMC